MSLQTAYGRAVEAVLAERLGTGDVEHNSDYLQEVQKLAKQEVDHALASLLAKELGIPLVTEEEVTDAS